MKKKEKNSPPKADPPRAEKEESSKEESLREIVEEIKEKYGEGSIMKLNEARRVDIDAIPTGSFSLDLALGIGGVPRGRVIEIFGPESSGKTSLALHIVAEAQKKGGLCAFVDAEHALDPEYAKKIGVKINDLLISQPDTGEQALDIVESLIRSGSIDVVVVDSVAALTPRSEIEGEMGAHHIGLQARLMSHALRKLSAIVAKTKTVLIFINQIRMQIGIMFGNPETTPGGKALKFYSSVRIDLRRLAQIKKGEEVVGSRTRVKIVKNKVAAPFKQTEFDIIYNQGISREGDMLNLGLKYELVKKSGNTLSYGETKLGVGFENAKEFLKANSEIGEKLTKEIWNLANSSQK